MKRKHQNGRAGRPGVKRAKISQTGILEIAYTLISGLWGCRVVELGDQHSGPDEDQKSQKGHRPQDVGKKTSVLRNRNRKSFFEAGELLQSIQNPHILLSINQRVIHLSPLKQQWLTA